MLKVIDRKNEWNEKGPLDTIFSKFYTLICIYMYFMEIVYSRKEEIMQYREDRLQDRTADFKFDTSEEGKVWRVDDSLTRNARVADIYSVVSAVQIRVKYLSAVPIFRDITRQGENTTDFLSI